MPQFLRASRRWANRQSSFHSTNFIVVCPSFDLRPVRSMPMENLIILHWFKIVQRILVPVCNNEKGVLHREWSKVEPMLKLDNDDYVHDCIKPQKLHQSNAIYQLDSFQSFVAIFIKGNCGWYSCISHHFLSRSSWAQSANLWQIGYGVRHKVAHWSKFYLGIQLVWGMTHCEQQI